MTIEEVWEIATQGNPNEHTVFLKRAFIPLIEVRPPFEVKEIPANAPYQQACLEGYVWLVHQERFIQANSGPSWPLVETKQKPLPTKKAAINLSEYV